MENKGVFTKFESPNKMLSHQRKPLEPTDNCRSLPKMELKNPGKPLEPTDNCRSLPKMELKNPGKPLEPTDNCRSLPKMELKNPGKHLEPTDNCRSLPKMELKNPGFTGHLYPDQIVDVGSATFGESQRNTMRKEKRKAEKETISRAVCALLNSGGGIALVGIANKNYDYKIHRLGLDIEKALTGLLSPSISSDYYDFIQIQSFLLIFVKTWSTQNGFPKLCSLETELYFRSFTSKLMANSLEALGLAEKKTKGKGKRARRSLDSFWQSDPIKPLLDKPYLCLDDKLELSESEHVEFKNFATENWEVRLKETIKSYFSAFGNSDGGYLIIGVHDDGRIIGCGKQCTKSVLETCIESAISKMKIAHFDNCESSDQFHILSIKDVKDKDQNDSGYVIFLEVKPLCCLAFAEDPQSWILDLKEVKRLSASEWTKIMTDKFSEPSLESQFERLEIGERPPLAKSVYRKKGLEKLEELQSNLFGSLEDEVTIKPDHLYSELKVEHPELEGQLNTVVANAKGVIILSRSWAVDLEKNSNSNVICDALLLVSGKHPKLYSVVKGEISQTELSYSRDTAFTLKKQLVNIGGYTKKLCVIPEVLQLNSEIKKPDFWPNITYPEKYKLDGFETVKELIQSLVIVMFNFRSYLSDKIGTEYFNLLTTEQYELLSKTFFKGPYFVHGPPGTGKTVIALKIIKKIKNTFRCSSDNILFICENTPLRKYVSDQKICQTMTRCSFERKNISNVEHIVADEAQNFQCEDGDWFKKAKQIIKEAGGTGVFYVFLDYFQSCHRKYTGLPHVDQQNLYTLTKVVRSPLNIYSFMLKHMDNIALKNGSPFMKELLENSECCNGVSGYFARPKHIDMCKIVTYVAKICKEYLSKGYPQGDIAILCNTESAVEQYRPKLEEEIKKQTKKLRLRIKPFESAENIMENAVVLDSVRRFSGLERPIIFGINPVCLNPKINDNMSLCAASRATAKLHLYYET